ncbi:hypothetical protein Tco_0394545 [Tanacetum coccineum]
MFESRQMTTPFPSRLNDYYCEEKKGSYGPQFSEAYSYGASHIDNSIPRSRKTQERKRLASLFIIFYMPEDVKVPLILRRSFLSTTHAKIDVFKRKITFRVGDEKIIFKSVKPASSLIKRVYMLSLRERMELDLEARLMRETLVLNRLLDPLYGDYIELNDLNVPLELRRDQVDDLMPIIEEVENMDGYRDQDMRDIILGEQFCKASCVEARRFDGLITIHNGSDNVTYQMARSHPRFKHLSNAQCNKFKSLIKVSQYGVFQFMDTAYWSPVQFV